MRYKDLASPEYPVAENDANELMHITLPIGESNVLMASVKLSVEWRIDWLTAISYQQLGDQCTNRFLLIAES